MGIFDSITDTIKGAFDDPVGTAIGAGTGFASGGWPGAVIGGAAAAYGSAKQAEAAEEYEKAQKRAAKEGRAAADPFAAARGPFQELLLSIYGLGPSPYEQQPSGQQTPAGAGGGNMATKGLLQRITATVAPGTGTVTNWQPQQPGQAITGGADQAKTTPAGPNYEMFRQTPGYQFALDEMMRTTQRGAAATGGVRSGKLIAELMDRAGGLASQTYGNEMQRIMQMAGVGAGSPAVAGQLYSQGIAGAGSTRGSAALGQGEAFGYGVGKLTDLIGGYGGTSEKTTWGDPIVDKGYGPVIPRDEFSGWGG